MRRIFVASLLVLLTACQGDELTTVRRADHAEDLIVIEGGSDVRSLDGEGIQRLTYEVRTPYPASGSIVQVARHLESRGWKPLGNNWFNRDESSEYVRGWVEYVASAGPGTKRHFVARWWAQWQNSNGDVVDYMFIYSSPADHFTNRDHLGVSATKMSAQAAEQLRVTLTTTAPVIELPAATPPNATTATDNSPDGVFILRPAPTPN